MPKKYSEEERVAAFWRKVDKSGECWLWTASTHPDGYGHFGVAGKVCRAHRVAYEWLVGPIPAGLTLDHLCRVRNCVNPDHLEPVTQRENVRRGELKYVKGGRDFCEKGHAFTPENTYLHTHRGQLRRRCLKCKNHYNRERYRRKASA